MLIDVFLHEFVDIYGSAKWSYSVLRDNKARIHNYVLPYFSGKELNQITSYDISKFYHILQTTYSPKNKGNEYCSSSVIREIHKLLSTAFEMAVEWELIKKNPCKKAIRPKEEIKKREIWTADEFFYAVEKCEDQNLKLCMHLAFAVTMRIGEIVGLRWRDVQLDTDKPYIIVECTLQRINDADVLALNSKDIIFKFPSKLLYSKSTLVLKKPKTDSSIRKIFIPASVADMLRRVKLAQQKNALDNSYNDYDLVICYGDGTPIEAEHISRKFAKLINDNNLKKVVFHSLRHTSITYKLIATNGDIKAIQGDSGHSQSRMITDLYAHILDETRFNTACLIEDLYYNKRKEKR